MFKIALTGGVASGKSTVAQYLRDLGVAVIDADEVARQVVAPGQPAARLIQEAFGTEVFNADGTLDRENLARRVFAHPAERQHLNELVHPWITREIKRRLKQFEAQGEPFVVVEVPLLFELGLESAYDLVIVVYTDRETQVRRLQDRDRRDRSQIEGIIKAQVPLPEKIRRADYLIDNRGSLQELRQKVIMLLKKIKTDYA
ncbi:MAG: dephospho-CoA kinase [Deltaproteobacteria bacterium]|nr:dephospho-CoA kinase [Deltaproteobacteria bacterium]MBW1952487.1 dephospho-CoA kinase [Deltaproteobacteria bacterium]MBW1987338.1 dephospho-CoA kinase [Deltaproteobacteria bacterium]MBW2135300.1 dephospho-CoA kinase [Deltaproteobacteria bacterium]